MLFSASIFAQTQSEVIEKFNEGADNVNKGEFSEAITDFEQVIAMAAVVGTEAKDLESKAKDQLPIVNYQVAINHIKQKNYEAAIPFLEKTVELSEEYQNNTEIKGKAESYLYKLFAGIGTQKYKENQHDEALELFDKSLKYMPENPVAFLGKGLIYFDDYDEENMVDALTKAIEFGKKHGDTKSAKLAEETLAKYYNNLGIEAIEQMDPVAEDFNPAIEAFETALQYDADNSTALYRLATIFNRQVEYDKAIESLMKALETAQSEVEIAAINFELGDAYNGNAQYDDACAAFTKAALDPMFEERALARKERVGCDYE
jgi:tetratricopeptide (TPR) repeat protein